MVTKNSKEIVDKLLNLEYTKPNKDDFDEYEKEIVQIMIDLDCSLSTALDVDFDMNGVDKKSVLSLVDYLEERLDRNMNKVENFMLVYQCMAPDMKLKRS